VSSISIITDSLEHVERNPVEGMSYDRPTTVGRRAAPLRCGHKREAQIMRKLEEEPHSGSEMLWLMAVLVIVLSTKVDNTVADIVMLAIAGYAMRAHSKERS
jgi:hypothetical protein